MINTTEDRSASNTTSFPGSSGPLYPAPGDEEEGTLGARLYKNIVKKVYGLKVLRLDESNLVII